MEGWRISRIERRCSSDSVFSGTQQAAYWCQNDHLERRGCHCEGGGRSLCWDHSERQLLQSNLNISWQSLSMWMIEANYSLCAVTSLGNTSVVRLNILSQTKASIHSVYCMWSGATEDKREHVVTLGDRIFPGSMVINLQLIFNFLPFLYGNMWCSYFMSTVVHSICS